MANTNSPIDHRCIIDLDAPPIVAYHWHQVRKEDQLPNAAHGSWPWNPSQLELWLSPKQITHGSESVDIILAELSSLPVANAHVLDFLLKNQDLIPEKWKKDSLGITRYIEFWGTIYREADGRMSVQSLFWYDGGPEHPHWDVCYSFITGHSRANNFALLVRQ